jgi:hypothetical protein
MKYENKGFFFLGNNFYTIAAIFAIILILLIPLGGCGDSVFEGISDDGSYEAKLEEARIALDDADYTKAIHLLEQLNAEDPNNQEVRQYLSNAYSGQGGLDTYAFLETIDDLEEEGKSGSIDMIGKVVGSDDGTLSSQEVTAKIGNMDDAIALMDNLIVARGLSGVERSVQTNDDRIVQRGLLGITRIVLLIGDLIIEQLGLLEVVMTEDGIQLIYADEEPDFDGIFDDLIHDKLADDIFTVAEAIDVIEEISGSDNDLHEDFDDFLNDIDADRNNRITQLEIEDYLRDIIN